jgi:hypothetical protein
MPTYIALILFAVIGALCLAMLAVARRWPGDRPWFGTGRSEDERGTTEAYAEALTRREIARRALLAVLKTRFGELTAPVVARIKREGAEWCEEILGRAITAGSLEELGLPGEPDASPTTSDSGHS